MKRVFDLISKYQRNYSDYRKLTVELKFLLGELLNSNGINFLQIETRVKSLPSFLDKIYRKISTGGHFSYPFADLVGVRVITYYNEDVYKIADLIEQEFEIHSKNSEYESHNRSPDQFGYSSLHYKVSLALNRNYSEKLSRYRNIVFEIQIRTVAQHAWATIDHKIRYKTAEKLPQDIQRQIFQLSALFELADTQFLAIKKKLEAHAREDLEKYKAGDLSVKINALTLEYFFEIHQETIQSIVDEAKKIGFRETTIRHDPNSIRYLLMLFQRLGVVSMGELETFFEEAQKEGPIIMQRIYQIISDRSIISIEYPFPIVLLIFITLRIKAIKFSDFDTEKVIQELLGSSVESISMSLKQRE